MCKIYYLILLGFPLLSIVQLSEKIQITVEEMRNLNVDNPDHMFLENYTQHFRNLGLIRRFVLFIIKLRKAYYHRSMKHIRSKISRNLESELPVILFVLKVLYDNDMLNAIDKLSK